MPPLPNFNPTPGGLDCQPAEGEIVYLVHLDRPIIGRNRYGLTATRHYVGTTASLPARLARHHGGSGAAYLAEAERRGIGWRVVGWWAGGRAVETEVKRRLGGRGRRAICPACQIDTPAACESQTSAACQIDTPAACEEQKL